MQQATLVSSISQDAASSPGSVTTADDTSLCVSVEHSPLALERHRAAWDQLVSSAAEPNPFLEPHALLSAWQHLGVPGLHVVLVWAPPPVPGKPRILAGLFPVVRVARYRGLPFAALVAWTHLYSYVATPLVRA